MAHVTDFKEAGFNTLLEELEWRGLIFPVPRTGIDIAEVTERRAHHLLLWLRSHRCIVAYRQPRAAHQHASPAACGPSSDRFGRWRHRTHRDPRQSGERTLNPKDVVAGWADRLKKQIGGILETEGSNPVRFVSNYDWTASMNVIDFLRDVGKNFRMGTMLAKDTVPVASTPRKASPSLSSAIRCCRATTSCTCSTSTIACWRSAAPTSGATSPPVWI